MPDKIRERRHSTFTLLKIAFTKKIYFFCILKIIIIDSYLRMEHGIINNFIIIKMKTVVSITKNENKVKLSSFTLIKLV